MKYKAIIGGPSATSYQIQALLKLSKEASTQSYPEVIQGRSPRQ